MSDEKPYRLEKIDSNDWVVGPGTHWLWMEPTVEEALICLNGAFDEGRSLYEKAHEKLKVIAADSHKAFHEAVDKYKFPVGFHYVEDITPADFIKRLGEHLAALTKERDDLLEEARNRTVAYDQLQFPTRQRMREEVSRLTLELATMRQAFNRGWYSCADVPPYDHPDSCMKCLGCFSAKPPYGVGLVEHPVQAAAQALLANPPKPSYDTKWFCYRCTEKYGDGRKCECPFRSDPERSA